MQNQNKNFNIENSRIPFYWFWGFAIALLTYTFFRADQLSLTCDEGSTYFSHVPYSVFNCFFSDGCWSDANNHLLNTFLMQGAIGTFGVSELSLRLPNLLGHLIYLIFSILLVNKFSKNFWIALAGFSLLNLNPYLIEFFSLARGYGLGVGWMMMSIFYLMKWIVDDKNKTGIYCYVGAILAVLSNFVFLNYWACLTAIFVFYIFKNLDFKKQDIYKKSFLQKISIPTFSILLLFFLLKKPIQTLQSKGEFVYGTDSLVDSFVGMIKISLMAQGYFDPFTTNVFILLSLILLSSSVGLSIFNFYKTPKNEFYKIHFAAVGLLILMVLAMIVQHYFLGVKYLEGRKTTMLFPILGLTVYGLIEGMSQMKSKKWAIGLAILTSIFSIIHFQRTFDLKETVEWKYDAQTKNMIAYLEETLPPPQKIHLGVHWVYGPASAFYLEYFKAEKIVQLTRMEDAELMVIKEPDFVYVQKRQEEEVSKLYIKVKDFGVGSLFKKR